MAEMSRRRFLAGTAALAAGAAVSDSVAWAGVTDQGTTAPAGDGMRVDAPTRLLAGLLDDPLGVGSPRPRLWWRVPVLSGRSGGFQHAYEVELVRDPRGGSRSTASSSVGRRGR